MRIAGVILAVLLVSPVWAQETPFLYDDHGKRDPFWRLISPSGSVINYDDDILMTDMVLEGVISDPRGNAAIINGRIVKPQDKIGLFTVSGIGKDAVTLIKGQESFTLKLKKDE